MWFFKTTNLKKGNGSFIIYELKDRLSCFSYDRPFACFQNQHCSSSLRPSFFLGRWSCSRRVSVVESGDLILGSFNLEFTRTKVLYYIRSAWVRFTFTALCLRITVGFPTWALRTSGEKKVVQVFLPWTQDKSWYQKTIPRTWVYLVLSDLGTFILLCVVYDNYM